MVGQFGGGVVVVNVSHVNTVWVVQWVEVVQTSWVVVLFARGLYMQRAKRSAVNHS